MSEPIRITPDVLHAVADDHDGVARQSRRPAPRHRHRAAVASYGPIMHQFKAAVGDVLAAPGDRAGEHGDEHRTAATTLRRGAAKYVAVDEENADRLRLDR